MLLLCYMSTRISPVANTDTMPSYTTAEGATGQWDSNGPLGNGTATQNELSIQFTTLHLLLLNQAKLHKLNW